MEVGGSNPLRRDPSLKLRIVNLKMKYYVYILLSQKDGSLYVGLTHDIKKRLKEYQNGLGNFTKGHLPYKIIFVSIFADKFIAARFEKYLKTASGKAFIHKRLIK